MPYPEIVPDWLPINTPISLVLGVYGPELVGAFPLQKYETVIEIHAAFLPSHRGAFAVNAAKQAFEWIWANTRYDKIIAEITEPNAQQYAIRCGMKKINNRFEVSRWADLSAK